MKPLFVFATEVEAAPLRELRPELPIFICGVGPIDTASSLVRVLVEQQPESVVLCGIAGAYDSSLAVGDVVSVRFEQTATLPTAYRVSYRADMDLSLPEVTSNTVMSVGAEPCGAQVENMEGAAFFSICALFGVPHAQIRAISNYVGDERQKWNIPLAVKRLAETIDALF